MRLPGELSAMTLATFGEDHVLYGTDFLHPIADLDGILARVNALPGTVRDKLRGGTAAALFGLSVATGVTAQQTVTSLPPFKPCMAA